MVSYQGIALAMPPWLIKTAPLGAALAGIEYDRPDDLLNSSKAHLSSSTQTVPADRRWSLVALDAPVISKPDSPEARSVSPAVLLSRAIQNRGPQHRQNTLFPTCR